MFFSVEKYGVDLIAWVILHNHMHFLVKLRRGRDLPRLINYITSRSSVLLNKEMNTPGRKNFYQYWDKCISTERALKTCINYIHYNPVIHHYVKNPRDYAFSSYLDFFGRYGEEAMIELFQDYPLSRDFDRWEA